jgi:DNA-binding HxlR family transcriptional regulator
MLAIDITESDILSAATHDPRGLNRVRVALEDAGLRVRQIAPSESDRRIYRLTPNGDPERAVMILQSIGKRPRAVSEAGQ